MRLLSVTSNRPQPGDIVDWTTGTDDRYGFLLSAPGPDPTVYTFTYETADLAGNTATCSTTVTAAYAPDHITGIAPHSAVAGAGTNIDLIITGDGFVNGATVRWNATPLSSTFVSENEIHATVPASAVASPGGVVVTVENPSPYAGVPGAGVFLVTQAQVSVTGMATGQATPEYPFAYVQTGAPAEGEADTLFVWTGEGQGTIAAATYSGNPGTAFAGGVNFFDVFVSPGATFQSAQEMITPLTEPDRIRNTADELTFSLPFTSPRSVAGNVAAASCTQNAPSANPGSVSTRLESWNRQTFPNSFVASGGTQLLVAMSSGACTRCAAAIARVVSSP
jgi:hypothetical protein